MIITDNLTKQSGSHTSLNKLNLMVKPDDIFFLLGANGAGKKLTTKELMAFLRESGLQVNAFDKRISTFSKGMRQKVGIAIAFAKDAKVLLLDEPPSGLDPKASNEVGEILKKLRLKGMATLMATHDLFRAEATDWEMAKPFTDLICVETMQDVSLKNPAEVRIPYDDKSTQN